MEPCFLAARSEYGYTTQIVLAMRNEPEAIDAAALELVTREAHDRELQAWATMRRRMLAEVEHLRAHLHSPHVPRAARALEREIDALDRKLR